MVNALARVSAVTAQSAERHKQLQILWSKTRFKVVVLSASIHTDNLVLLFEQRTHTDLVRNPVCRSTP